MPLPNQSLAYLEAYYALYLGLCAALIFWLGRTLHRTGSTFLNDAFAGNLSLVRVVSHLLDVGFYLISIGYVAITYRTFWQIVNSYEAAIEFSVAKLGGFMLILGFAHMFNLLLLAIFRRRSASACGHAGSPAHGS
jgi:hypothetical protein